MAICDYAYSFFGVKDSTVSKPKSSILEYMSYNVTILRNSISLNNEQAWDELEELYEKEDSTTEQGKTF